MNIKIHQNNLAISVSTEKSFDKFNIHIFSFSSSMQSLTRSDWPHVQDRPTLCLLSCSTMQDNIQ